MIKKSFVIFFTILFAVMPTATILAEEINQPNQNSNQNSVENQQNVLTDQNQTDQSPATNGDFFNPFGTGQAPDSDKTQQIKEKIQEKKEIKTMPDPTGAAPDSSDAKKEEPTDDDPPVNPHVYNDNMNGVVEKSKFNKSKGEAAVDNFSGALTYAYQFDLPAGRNGLQPDLKLSYNSQLRNFSNIVGLGWNLDLIDIRQEWKYNDLRNYTLNFYGNNKKLVQKDLINDQRHGEYIATDSDFTYVEYASSTESWKMIDKNGLIYILGTTNDSRLYSTTTGGITKFFVDEIRDTNDNFIRFEYFKNDNQVYPKRIVYTGHGTTDGDITINIQPFATQTTVDRLDVNTSYEYRIYPNIVTTRYLVNGIEILINNNLEKKYELNYTPGDNGKTSLLSSVQEIGVSGGQELERPATTFEYTQKERSFANNGDWKAPNQTLTSFGTGGNPDGNQDFGARIYDANGDGLVDIIKSGSNNTKDYLYGETIDGAFMNNGVSGWNQGGCGPGGFVGEYGEDLGVRAIDVNGDGLVDIIKSLKKEGYSPVKETWINKGNCEFEQTTDYLLPVYIVSEQGTNFINFADYNGDGFIDISESTLNNGKDGWIEITSLLSGGEDVNLDGGTRVADVNGDGLPDILNNDSNTKLNDGQGVYENLNKWVSPVPFTSFDIPNQKSYDLGARLADINGDGLVDIVSNGAIFLNDGVDSFDYVESWIQPVDFTVGGQHVDTGARLADVNGDNLVDIVLARLESSYQIPVHDGPRNTYLNSPDVPNLLTKINNGFGKSDEIDYKSSINNLNVESVASVNYINGNYVDHDNNSTVQTGLLKVGTSWNIERYRSFMHFDLSSLPENVEIIGFRLQLTLTNANADLNIHQVLSAWDASTITWDNQPATGAILCRRGNVRNGTWQFYCEGPLDDNGLAVRTVPDMYVPSYSVQIQSASLYDVVYKTSEIVNPNQKLRNTVEIVDKIQSNDSLTSNLSFNEYKYSEGDQAVENSSQIIPNQLIINQNQGGSSGMGTKVGQTFFVNMTDDYNLASIWVSRNVYTLAENIHFFIKKAGWNTQHQTWEPDPDEPILAELTVPINEFYYSPPGYPVITPEFNVNFPTPAHLLGGNGGPSPTNLYWFGIEGLPYNANDGFNLSISGGGDPYDCSETWLGNEICVFYIWNTDQGYYYNAWYPFGNQDLKFQIGKQSRNIIRNNTEFAGFGKVETTDQAGNKNITYYHQGGGLDGSAIGEFEDSYPKRGRPFRIENYDSNNNLLSQTLNKWNANVTFASSTIAVTSTFVYLEQSVDLLFNSSGSHKDTAKSYTYDFDTGNLLTEENLGEVTADTNTGEYTDVSGDEKLTTYEYAINEDDHILSAVKNKTISDPNTQDEVSQDYYYDNLSYGQVEHYNVTKEDLPVQTINNRYAYNNYGLVTDKYDAKGATTTIVYDSYNLYPAETTNALNQTFYTEYNLLNGEVGTTTDANGLISVNDYDALGRLVLVKTSNPDNPSQLINRESYEYHDNVSQGEPWWIKHSIYATTTGNPIDDYSYFDGFGRVVQERKQTATSNQFSVTSYQYDDRGNLEKQSLPYFESGSSYSAPNWSTVPKNEYTYDALNRVLTVTNSLGTTSNSYDLWKTTITDANNKIKNIYHDAYNHLIKVDEILNSTVYPTTYTYNYLDKLTNITDSQNNTRNFTYDDLGRLIKQEEMHTSSAQTWGEWDYEYDLNSNLTQKTDPKNQTVNYTYDKLNRKLTENYAGSAGVEASYGYDWGQYGIGHMTSSTASSTIKILTTLTYDILGRNLSETKEFPAASKTYTTKYTYDLLNNPYKITYPDDFYARYEYNNIGQANKVIIKNPNQAEQGIIDNITYTPLGQMDDITYANGTVVNNTYDPAELYRLTAKQTSKSGTNFQNIAYDYDSVGNITQIIDTAPNQLAKTVDYVYDDLYRLTTATITTTTSLVLTYSYDPIGNITVKSDIGNYLYQNSNPYQTNSVNGRSYVYDNNGNLTSDTQRTMTYDFDDRMASVTKGATTTLYYYDVDKDRQVKFEQTTHNYRIYPNKYMEDTRANGKKKYIFLGNTRLGTIDQSSTTTPLLFLNFSDHLNSASITTDSQGNVTNLNDYLPYGGDRINIKNSTFTPTFKFTDQELDSDSGIYYFGSRFYNQNIGKFIQIDPVSLALANPNKLKELSGLGQQDFLRDPQSLNDYSYSRNNPVIFKDQDGNFWQLFGAAAGAVAGFAWSMPNIVQEAKYIYNGNWNAAAQQSNIMMEKIGAGVIAGATVAGVAAMANDMVNLGKASSVSWQINEAEKTINIEKNSNLRYTQSSASEKFSNSLDTPSLFRDKSTSNLVGGLQKGSVSPSEIQINYIERGGFMLTDNNRSTTVLQRAGINFSKWNLINRTGDINWENRINNKLEHNELGYLGTNQIIYK